MKCDLAVCVTPIAVCCNFESRSELRSCGGVTTSLRDEFASIVSYSRIRKSAKLFRAPGH